MESRVPWLWVGDWSPVLPAAVLFRWEQALAAVRPLRPDGQPNPWYCSRTPPRPARRTALMVSWLLYALIERPCFQRLTTAHHRPGSQPTKITQLPATEPSSQG